MNALRAWPKLVNYEPEFEEGHKTLVSVATPLYEGGPPKAPPPFAPALHVPSTSHPQHLLRTRSAPAAPGKENLVPASDVHNKNPTLVALGKNLAQPARFFPTASSVRFLLCTSSAGAKLSCLGWLRVRCRRGAVAMRVRCGCGAGAVPVRCRCGAVL